MSLRLPAPPASFSSSLAPSGSKGMPSRSSLKPGMPGGRTPLAGTTRSLSTISSASTCLSIAMAKARRTFGSSNGGSCVLKPM